MAAERAIIVATDFGLMSFAEQASALDTDRQTHNLISGTEYAVLEENQSTQFAEGSYDIELQDVTRYAGAFALIFTNPPSRVESQTV